MRSAPSSHADASHGQQIRMGHAEVHYREAHAVWEKLEKKFTNLRGMSFGWLVRLNSERINSKRFIRLTKKAERYGLPALFSPLTVPQLAMLQERSAINLKMASDALRLYVVINVSIPVALFVLVNQLAPTFFARLFGTIEPISILFIAISFIATLMITTWYAYAGVHQARDLNYLLVNELASARLIERSQARDDRNGYEPDPDDPDTDDFGAADNEIDPGLIDGTGSLT
ncbi:MAG: hypothetical protein AAFW83_09830 [Pseudomonadota bacterium]